MTNLSHLSRDLLISCLAKIPLVHYSTVSFTSKAIGKLLSFPELYNSRSEEIIAYVSLEDSNGLPKWFSLSKKPLSTTLSTVFWLTPISMEVSYPGSKSLVTADRKVFMLQTQNPEVFAVARLRILDCISKKWSLTGPIVNARNDNAVLLEIKGDIWVIGGTNNQRSLCPEVYSTKTHLWSTVTEPMLEDDASVVLINSNGEDRVEIWKTWNSQAV